MIENECQSESYIPHIVVAAAGSELHTDSISAPNLSEDLQDLEAETRPILDTPTPFIGALIGIFVQELGYNITIGAMHYPIYYIYGEAQRNRTHVLPHRSLLPLH